MGKRGVHRCIGCMGKRKVNGGRERAELQFHTNPTLATQIIKLTTNVNECQGEWGWGGGVLGGVKEW